MYCGGILEYSNNGKSNLFMMKIFKYFRVLRIDILTIQRICYHDVDDTIELVDTLWWRYIRSILYINTQLITSIFLSIKILSLKFKSCMIHKIPVITAIKKWSPGLFLFCDKSRYMICKKIKLITNTIDDFKNR